MAEITLQQEEEIALFRKLMNEPKTRRRAIGLVNEVDPGKYTFHDDQALDEIDKLKAGREEDKAERERERIESRLRSQRDKLAGKFSPEQIAEIEKFATENGIGNYEIAAKAWAADLPPPEPRAETPALFGERWQMPPRIDDFRKDPSGAAIRGAREDIVRLMAGKSLVG